MTFRVQWHLVCDQCKQQSKQRNNDSRKVEAACLKAGWQQAWHSGGMHHLCPACVAAGVTPEWWRREAGKQ